MSVSPIYYSEDVKRINEVEFTIYRNKDVKQYSAVSDDPFGIDLNEAYENYEPKKGGLVDLRLGTCDIYLPCTTCGENSIDCPGHFGHTELAEPVFHYGFLNHLKNILQCICLKCAKILVDKPDILLKKIYHKKPEHRFKEVKIQSKNINYCHNCGAIVPKIKREVKDNGTIKILLEMDVVDENINDTKKLKQSLSPRDCYNILKNISDDDCYLLGFNTNVQRPEDLIIEKFPIPPVIIRPTAKVDHMSAATMEDSLTLQISSIINHNKRLRNQLEKENISDNLSTYNQDMFSLLQLHIAIYFDNDSLNLPRTEFKTGGKTIKSISERIKGKTGRVRNNLMGKRVDFSARSVITSDPYIDIDQVGVPKKIAMELTIPEEVTPYNIKYLTCLVKNGRDTYPGANFVLKINYRDGKTEIQKIDLKYRKKEIRLNYGDIVERHCVDGDYVLFNRQPTLHKPSMMGHKIQVIDNDELNTFRMSVSVCKPYNADFDGDEMNIHLAQSIQSRNELRRIANVQYQIISVKDSSPIIGCQQDALSGGYMLTEANVKIKGWEVANILCNTASETKYNIDMNKEYTGHEIFSHIIPKGINNTVMSGDKIKFQIINGKLTIGHLSKSSLSFTKNSIIHFIWDKYGPNKTKVFIDDAQRLILNYLLLRGQTVGFKDVIISNDIKDKINQIVNNEVLKSKYNITQYENESDPISLDTIENSLVSELSIVQANIGKMLMSYFNSDNFFWVAAESGAKGSLSNIAQMSGVIGQQILEGVRIKKNVEGRSMIYYHRDDDTPESRGFIKNSFATGLKGPELFINAAAGRIGAIDTAIKTAQTGYIQRQLVKCLEDLVITYDGTNRNAKKVIIQPVYGDNGIDQTKQTEISLKIVTMDNKTLEKELTFNDAQLKKLEKDIKISSKELKDFNNKYLDKIKSLRDKLRDIQYRSLTNYKILEEKYMLPVNLLRITQDYSNKKELIELNPIEIEEDIIKFLTDYDNRIITCISSDNDILKEDDRRIKLVFETALYEYLAPVKCIFEYGLSKNDFRKLMEEVRLNFIRAIAEAGEMVGIIAAQSIGEPTSQMTLNTKHTAGVKSASSSTGVARIQELLHYSKNIKTPQMIIYFTEPYSTDRNKLNKVISYFKHLTIRELLSSVEVYYDVGGNDIQSKMIRSDNVLGPFFVNNQKADINSLPFVFRMKMNIEKMLDKETTLLDIKTKFISHWYKNYNNIKNLKKNEKDVISKISRCAILSNSPTEKEQIIHIRFSINSFNNNTITEFVRMVIDDITLKGIENIDNIDVSHEMKISFDKETGSVNNNKEYVVYTAGINIDKLRHMRGIDFTRSKCNDIGTVYRMYGIEAARQMLFNELVSSYAETSVSKTHLSLLVDHMCYLGDIISIDRHGIAKIDMDPIARSSFELMMDHYVKAALFNEKDLMQSVSSRVAIGRAIAGGTGAFELLLDTKKLENSEYTEDETGGRVTFTPLEEEPILNDIIKYLGKIDFFIPNM